VEQSSEHVDNAAEDVHSLGIHLWTDLDSCPAETL
jgi:hypothetical protein